MEIDPPSEPEAVVALVHRAAHDLNGLLQVIVGNATFLRDDLPEGTERREAEAIEAAASQAIELVRHISDLVHTRKGEASGS